MELSFGLFYFGASEWRAAAAQPPAAPVSFKLLYANVNLESGRKAEVKSLIDSSRADIVALVEVDQSWSRELALTQAYPFSHEVLRGDKFGLGLYSKFPSKGKWLKASVISRRRS